VLAITEELFGQHSRIYLSIANLPWRRQGSFIVDPWIHGTMDYNEIVEQIHHKAYLEQLDTAKGLISPSIYHDVYPMVCPIVYHIWFTRP
jgi:hypothetical protein